MDLETLAETVVTGFTNSDIFQISKNNNQKLKICSYNINSISKKFESVQDLLITKEIDLLLLQETRTVNLDSFHNALDDIGYSYIHASPYDVTKNSTIKHGNAVIYRSNLQISRHSPAKPPSQISPETWARILSVKIDDCNLLIHNLYMPAMNSALTKEQNDDVYLECLGYLESVISDNNNNILAGDWNCDYYRDKDHYLRGNRHNILSSFLDSYSQPDLKMNNQSLKHTFTSHNSDESGRIHYRYLDRIVHSLHANNCTEYEVSDLTASDHLPVIATFIIPTSIQKNSNSSWSKRIAYGKITEDHIIAYKNMLNRKLNLIPENKLLGNAGLNNLINIMETLAFQTFPKTKRPSNKTVCKLWLQTVKPYQKECQRWHKILTRMDPTNPNFQFALNSMKSAKKQFKNAVTAYNREKFSTKAQKCMGEGNVFNIFKKRKKPLSPPSSLAGQPPEKQLSVWNQHYNSVLDGSDHPKNIDCNNNSKMAQFSLGELNVAIQSIDTNKSFKRHWLWKNGSTQTCRKILLKNLNLWNKQLISEKNAPWDFLISTISPILKADSKPKSELKSYRPISLMSSEAWILESMMKYRLLPYLNTFDNQFGYKSSHGCVQAISILQSLNWKTEDSWVLTLDASSAFDVISHERISNQLKKRGVPEKLRIVALGMMYNSNFLIRWNNSISKNSIFPNRGTKQGGLLSAIIFSACYDDLIIKLNNANPGVILDNNKISNLVYADDICLMSGSRYGLRKLYQIVMKFAAEYNDLIMNPSKSFILRMGTQKNLQPSSFDNIPTTDSTKYLGATIATGQKKQTNEEVLRAARQIYVATNTVLRHEKSVKYLNSSGKNSIISAYGTPYCIELFDNVDSKIRKAHRNMVKRFYPRSHFIKDGGGYDISSTTLYQQIAGCRSLGERHTIIRTKMISNAQKSDNKLIKNLVGSLKVHGADVSSGIIRVDADT